MRLPRRVQQSLCAHNFHAWTWQDARWDGYAWVMVCARPGCTTMATAAWSPGPIMCAADYPIPAEFAHIRWDSERIPDRPPHGLTPMLRPSLAALMPAEPAASAKPASVVGVAPPVNE